jgi:hypothetical protein
LQEAALKTNGLHMGALLILPIQRIPRYVLLLQVTPPPPRAMPNQGVWSLWIVI